MTNVEREAMDILELVDNAQYISLTPVGEHKVQLIAQALQKAEARGRKAMYQELFSLEKDVFSTIQEEAK